LRFRRDQNEKRLDSVLNDPESAAALATLSESDQDSVPENPVQPPSFTVSDITSHGLKTLHRWKAINPIQEKVATHSIGGLFFSTPLSAFGITTIQTGHAPFDSLHRGLIADRTYLACGRCDLRRR